MFAELEVGVELPGRLDDDWEGLYVRAIRAAPGLAEAHLRRGLTLWKLQSSEGASAAPLRRVLELTSDPDLRYRAHMGLGRLVEAKDRFEDALAHFRSAAKLKPGWQVAHLAMAHALHRMGARAASRAALEDAVTIPVSEENLLGWWSYELGLSERGEPLFIRMRSGVAR